jgi:hypothetical protein
MPTVTINKTEYTKIADAALAVFTAQCRAVSGWEAQFGASQPAVTVAGALVPGVLGYGVTRANGTSHCWGKLPADAPVATAEVVVLT